MEAPRFDTILDIDHIGYVINPNTGYMVKLNAVEGAAKFYYLKSWRIRLDALQQVASYQDTGGNTPIPTTALRSHYPDDKSVYKPKYSMRYEEYLASRENLV